MDLRSANISVESLEPIFRRVLEANEALLDEAIRAPLDQYSPKNTTITTRTSDLLERSLLNMAGIENVGKNYPKKTIHRGGLSEVGMMSFEFEGLKSQDGKKLVDFLNEKYGRIGKPIAEPSTGDNKNFFVSIKIEDLKKVIPDLQKHIQQLASAKPDLIQFYQEESKIRIMHNKNEERLDNLVRSRLDKYSADLGKLSTHISTMKSDMLERSLLSMAGVAGVSKTYPQKTSHEGSWTESNMVEFRFSEIKPEDAKKL